jgi:hypothetical protein
MCVQFIHLMENHKHAPPKSKVIAWTKMFSESPVQRFWNPALAMMA